MSIFRHFAVSALALACWAPLSVAAQDTAPASTTTSAVVARLQAQFVNADGLVAKVTKRNLPAGRAQGVVSTGWLRITAAGNNPALRLDLIAENKLALVAIVTGQQLWMYQSGQNDQVTTQSMDNAAMLQLLQNLAQIEQNFTVTSPPTKPNVLSECTGCTFLQLNKKNAAPGEKPLYVAVGSQSNLAQVSIPQQGTTYWNFQFSDTPTIHKRGSKADARLNANWFSIPTGLRSGSSIQYLDENGKPGTHTTGKEFKTVSQ